MKVLPFLILVFLSSCGGRVLALAPEVQRQLAGEDVPPEVTPIVPSAAEKPVPVATSSPVVTPTATETPTVVTEVIATDVELIEAGFDPEIERVSVVIDAPIGSEVTYQIDGGEPVAAGLSFEIDDVSAREHVIEVSIFVPGGASKEFRLEWDEKATLPQVSEAVVENEGTERMRKRWKRTEFKRHDGKKSSKSKKKSKGKSEHTDRTEYSDDSDEEGEEQVIPLEKNKY